MKKDEFVRQIGAGLRLIRKRAGLNLKQLARQIAPESESYFRHLSRLERGEIKRPSINLIAEYLTACGSSFSEIIDILNQATRSLSRGELKARASVVRAIAKVPEPLKTEIQEIDRRLARIAPESVEKRVARAKMMLKNRIHRSFLEDTLYSVITAPEVKELPKEKIAGLCRWGRKVFVLLKRTRNAPARRERLLPKEREQAAAQDLPDAGITAMAEAVMNLFNEMEKQGLFQENLDHIPEQVKLQPPVRAEKRVSEEREQEQIDRAKDRAYAHSRVFLDMNREIRVDLMEPKRRALVMDIIQRLFNIAVEFNADPEEKERRFNELINSSLDPDLARDLYNRFLTVFPKYREKALG